MSHPTWVRGLKPEIGKIFSETLTSHPTWVRGLKPMSKILIHKRDMSHPTWVRGLKLLCIIQSRKDFCVAPYVGAWIETLF